MKQVISFEFHVSESAFFREAHEDWHRDLRCSHRLYCSGPTCIGVVTSPKWQ
jgi:hypothetical protein